MQLSIQAAEIAEPRGETDGKNSVAGGAVAINNLLLAETAVFGDKAQVGAELAPVADRDIDGLGRSHGGCGQFPFQVAEQVGNFGKAATLGVVMDRQGGVGANHRRDSWMGESAQQRRHLAHLLVDRLVDFLPVDRK